MKLLALPLLLLATLATAAGPAATPRVVVLGIAQDGGMPQTGCDCSHCSAARRNPALARHVASLAIHVPKTGHVYLVDATPDLPAQVEMIHAFRPHPEGKVDRAPVDGVLLTHAHIGHYLGLAHLGFESLNTRNIPVWASPRMAAYLRANGPWSQLVRLENIALRELQPGQPFDLEAGISVKAIQVPHRDVCGTFLPDHTSRKET
jgi:pyrroloquinoline quinone biosynthesis protein B